VSYSTSDVENLCGRFHIPHDRPGPPGAEVIQQLFDPVWKLAFVLAVIGIVIGSVKLLIYRVAKLNIHQRQFGKMDHPANIQMARVEALPASPHGPSVVCLSRRNRIAKPAENNAMNINATLEEPSRYARKKRIGLTAVEIVTAMAKRAGSRRFLKSKKSNACAHTYPGKTNISGKRPNARREPKIS
jgi:hypothetical protein